MVKLLPSSEVMISESKYPKGWFVASYDEEGFTIERKWFPPEDKAKAELFAKELEEKAWQ